MKIKMLIFVIIVNLPTTYVYAQDIGDIALIEDTDGSITKYAQLPDFYLAAAAKAFYKTHKDIYDDIFVFHSTTGGGIQQGWPVYLNVKGIGRDLLRDQRARFGVPNGKLKMAVKMGSLPSLPDNPDDRAQIVPGYPLTGAELMGHEYGHQYLASITYKKNGVLHCWIRGMESSGNSSGEPCDGYTTGDFNQHWSYFFNSRSVMYGSFIKELGNDTFEFSYPNVGYSDLDQYLMGLRRVSEVDQSQLFLVDTGNLITGSASLPLPHGTSTIVKGKKISFSMDDIIAAVGVRNPELEPCHRKVAFILVYPKGQFPSQTLINKVDRYRKRWETWYEWATDGRASADTTLDGRGTGTEKCPGQSLTNDAGYRDVDNGDIYIQDITTDDVKDIITIDITDTSMDEEISDIAPTDIPNTNYDIKNEDLQILSDIESEEKIEDTNIKDDIAIYEDSKKTKNDLNTLSDEPSGCNCATVY
ncbi:MAG: hypothetical protein N2746_10815 [Deltaproteobacteria bacterium]|nr:hypothetical protein [Deltaproteobacteria bacterium]